MIILKILLILLAAILLLLIALLLLKAKVTIGYRDELELTVTVLGIPIRILPKRQKQVKVRRYNLRRMRRVEEKRKKKALAAQQKASEKQRKKAQRKAEKKASAQSKPQTPRLILSLLKIFFVRFGHHLHIDITRLRLVIATDDAAKTAILWGAVCPTVAAILELLDRGTNLHTDRATDIDVAVDYLSDSITADICIAFTLRVWHLADIGLRLLFGFLKHKSSPQSA